MTGPPRIWPETCCREGCARGGLGLQDFSTPRGPEKTGSKKQMFGVKEQVSAKRLCQRTGTWGTSSSQPITLVRSTEWESLALYHGVMYVLSFAWVIALFATVIALAVWLLMRAW